MAVTQFTTWDQVARRISATGVDLRIDHAPTEAFDEANDAASLYVLTFLGQRYPVALLVTSNWVASVTTDICIWFLEQWRNNPVSGSVAARKEMWDEMLKAIQQNKMVVPDISNALDRPEVRGQKVALDRYPSIRNTDAGSTDYRPAQGQRFPDRTEPPLR